MQLTMAKYCALVIKTCHRHTSPDTTGIRPPLQRLSSPHGISVDAAVVCPRHQDHSRVPEALTQRLVNPNGIDWYS